MIDENKRLIYFGRFGYLNDKQPIQIIPTILNCALKFNYVSVGNEHILTIDENYKLWTIGSNEYGQRGINKDENKKEEKLKSNEIKQFKTVYFENENEKQLKFISIICGPDIYVLQLIQTMKYTFGETIDTNNLDLKIIKIELNQQKLIYQIIITTIITIIR